MAQHVDSKQALRLLPQDYASVQVEQVPDTRTPEEIAEDEATRIQARSEGVDLITDNTEDGKKLARRVEFQGKEFRIADKVGLMPLMEFAYHANSGIDTSDMGALAAIYEMLQDCISQDQDVNPATGKPEGPTEWDRFRAHAKQVKAGAEELMPVVQQTVELLSARPTSPESDSSSPSRQMSPSLTDTSSGQREGLVPVTDLGKLASLG